MINYLKPVRYNQKSYYGKAIVESEDVSGGVIYRLYSYNTYVANVTKAANGALISFDCDWYSRTTNKHIKDFIYQYADYTI